MKNIETRVISTKYYREFHFTLGGRFLEKPFLKKFFSDLEKKGIILSKVVFLGNPKKVKELMPLFQKHPFSQVGNSLSGNNREYASLHICGISILEGEARPVEIGQEILGYHFIFPDFEWLSVSGVFRQNKQTDFKKEVQKEYDKIDKILSRHGFSAKDIYRFWNYMARIAKNYPAFNEVRNWYFAKNSIRRFPAATGIEALLGFGKKASLGFEALKTKNKKAVHFEPVHSDMQCEAHSYGPKFSRAMLVTFPKDKLKKLYISGTSSVNEKGESILTNDPGKNVAYVMKSIGHLLKNNALTLNDLAVSYVYFKNDKVFAAFQKLYRNKKWTFPYSPVFTQICRSDLIFEMEVIASNKLQKR